MSLHHRLAIAVLTLSLACGGDADTDAQPLPPAPSPADAPQMGAGNPADIAEVADYGLTIEAVQQMHRAQLNIYTAMQQNPQLAQLASMDAEEFSLDALEQRFGSVPEIRDAISQAGLTVREYGVIMLALFQASFAQASIEMGAQRDAVIAATQMNPANLDFVVERRDDLRRMQEELAAAASDAGGARQ